MNLADRTGHLGESRIRSVVENAPEDAVDLCWGKPDLDTPEHVKRAATDAIDDGRATGYTNHRGIRPLREAIADSVAYDAGPEHVLVTAGTAEALHLAVMAHVDPGDEVLVPDPGFLSYESLVRIAGGTPVRFPLDDAGRPDPAVVADAIAPETAAILVNTPVNPTAAVATREQARGLAELADDRDVALISDEVYGELVYDAEHVSPAAFGENVVVANSLSKSCAMTGWRLGFVVARPARVDAMRTVHQSVQICAAAPSQYAGLAALTGPQEPLREMVAEYRARRDVLVDGLRDLGLDSPTPEGTFYAYPEVPDGFVEACAERGLLVLNGDAFGDEGAGHVRVSYAGHGRETLRGAVATMEAALADLDG